MGIKNNVVCKTGFVYKFVLLSDHKFYGMFFVFFYIHFYPLVMTSADDCYRHFNCYLFMLLDWILEQCFGEKVMGVDQ